MKEKISDAIEFAFEIVVDLVKRINETYDMIMVGVAYFLKYGILIYLVYRFGRFIYHLF
jgi:hypothetical protein